MKNGPKWTAKMYKKIQNETNQFKGKINLLQDRLEQFKRRQSFLEKGLEQIAKMQNLSQNELNQITKMQNQSRDKLEQIAEMGRIKNYGKMPKEELIIALLKSKRSLADLFNNNLDNGKISEIKKIVNKLRDILTKEHRKKIKKNLTK